jgi:cardiolipin synthase
MVASKRLLLVVGTAIATAGTALAVLNLSLGTQQLRARPRHRYAVSDPQFLRAMGAVLDHALLPGNHVQELVNGDAIFGSMIDAIRSARRTITLETYIYWSGTIGAEFVDALVERALDGVRVHVLLDWVGGRLDRSQLRHLRDCGVELRRYNRPRWVTLDRVNNRTHRKLMVVDGRIGYIGGAGIADAWRGDAQDADHWRDTHFRVEGPVVNQLQAAFNQNWMKTTGEVLHDEAYLPAVPNAGSSLAQVFTSSPGGGSESMQLMMLMSVSAAAQSIDLSAAYFIPGKVSVAALVASLRRGVRVRIIVPSSHIDWSPVRWASRATWGPLLDAGAQIHEYQPTMFHCKVLIVDGLWVSVGSTNFDSRSFSINDEANMNVYDADFARRQTAVFERDLQRCWRITPEAWHARSQGKRLLERVASLVSPQL